MLGGDLSAMDDVKCIWVAGMPRSGSMWAYNVIRRLLGGHGWEVMPKNVPLGEPQKDQCYENAVADPNPNRIWVLKTHRKIPPDLPKARFINTQRDIRDALMSYIRFMRCDFETGLNVAVGMTSNCDHYARFSDDLIHRIDYREILNRPAEVGAAIGRFFGIRAARETIQEIVDDLTKENVRKLIQKKESEVRSRLDVGSDVRGTELIRNLDGTYRARDETTGFQGGHISDYRDGDWRDLLTMDQRRQVHRRLGPWLHAHGYPPDPEMAN